MNKRYKEEMHEIYASEELIQNTIDKINLKSRKNSFEVIKKIALGTVAMMMLSVTTYAVVTGIFSSWIDKKFKDNNGEEYTYKIPQIDIESEDAEKMNEEIKEKYGVYYNEAIKHIEEGFSIVGEVDYKAYINGNILSVVAYRRVNGDMFYSTYNININTGKKVENKELLEMKGLNEDKVEKEIIAYMEEIVKSAEYEEMTESEIKEIQEYLLNRVYETKINENSQFYLSNENHLCVVANKYVMAGAEKYERLYDLEEHKLVEGQYE